MINEITVSDTATAPDPAAELLKRIQRIAIDSNATMQQAAWAIIVTEWNLDMAEKIPYFPYEQSHDLIPPALFDLLVERVTSQLSSASNPSS